MKRCSGKRLRPLGALALSAMLGAFTAGAAVPDTLAEARAAAAAGDVDRALGLYDQVIADEPDHVAALAESAQQLSWQRHFDEAVARYERVLALHPDHRFARLERAKVLSWAERYGESVEAFRAVLAETPDDDEARIGLARVLSWSGQLTDARAEYNTVLSEHPGYPAALLGVAQTWAWSGDLDRARPAYEAAAGASADSKDAEIGLAYLDLWAGQSARARRSAETLAARHPDDPDTLELLAATRTATAPWFGARWDVLDDSDRNRLEAMKLETGVTPGRGPALRFTYTDYDVRTLAERGTIRSLEGVATWRAGPRQSIETMLGTDRLERPGLDAQGITSKGLRWSFPIADVWSGSAAARREPFRYSVPLIDNRIVIDSLSFAANGEIGNRWRLWGETSAWKLSDGNRREAVQLSARRAWQRASRTVEAGFNARQLAWDRDLDNGYFDPTRFHSFGLVARVFKPTSATPALDYDLSAEIGVQSFDTLVRSTSNDPYFRVVARLGWQVSPTFRLEGWAEKGSYAWQGDADWRYERVGLRLVHRFGMK